LIHARQCGPSFGKAETSSVKVFVLQRELQVDGNGLYKYCQQIASAKSIPAQRNYCQQEGGNGNINFHFLKTIREGKEQKKEHFSLSFSPFTITMNIIS
jgi:hypothetical protein